MSRTALVLGGDVDALVSALALARRNTPVTLVVEEPAALARLALVEVAKGFRAPALHHAGGADLAALAAAVRGRRRRRSGIEPAAPPLLVPGRDGAAALALGKTLTVIGGEPPAGLAARYDSYAAIVQRSSAFLSRLAARAPLTLVEPVTRQLLATVAPGLAWLRMPAVHRNELMAFMPAPAADVLGDRLGDSRAASALAGVAAHATSVGPMQPGTATLLLHAAATGGFPQATTWPSGGLATAGEALLEAVRAAGVEILVNEPIAALLEDGPRAVGAVTARGTELRARAVISSLGLRRTFELLPGCGLLGAGLLSDLRTHRDRGASARLLLALDRLPRLRSGERELTGPELSGCWMIDDGMEGRERAADAARRGELPERPALEVMLPSLSQPDLAPAGQHVLTAWVHHAPFTPAGRAWDDVARERLAARAVAMLEEFSPGIAASIVGSTLLAPPDLETRCALPGGHVAGGELALDQLYSLRPSPDTCAYRTPVRGLYLTGASCHPGAPLSGAAGLNTARAVLADLPRDC